MGYWLVLVTLFWGFWGLPAVPCSGFYVVWDMREGWERTMPTKVQKSSYMELFSKINEERFGWFSNVR